MNYCINFWCDWFNSLNWSNWINSLNPIEIFFAAIAGLLTALIASKIYANKSAKNKAKRLDKKYKPIEGIYIRWFKEDKQIGKNQIHAKAYLKHYDGENRLDIRVETFMHVSNGSQLNKPHVWTGEIVMDTVRSGTVVWEQKIPNIGKNGFKRIIVGNNLDEITLVGESVHGYGVERFTEKEISTS